MAKLKMTSKQNAIKDVEQLELWYTAGGNVKLYKHFGEVFGISFKRKTLMSQQSQP